MAVCTPLCLSYTPHAGMIRFAMEGDHVAVVHFLALLNQYFALRLHTYRREHAAAATVPLVLLLLTPLESPAVLQGTVLPVGQLDPLADLPCIFDALPTKHIRTNALAFTPTAY